ncbi:hypothetical protein [Kitasatospora sp. NPDC017646]|uniref:hypothetical protein n=1 Tax=Kitasatospora sp. NPDC017646 TaxID=3364024 RepID=UPI0037AB0C07
MTGLALWLVATDQPEEVVAGSRRTLDARERARAVRAGELRRDRFAVVRGAVRQLLRFSGRGRWGE